MLNRLDHDQKFIPQPAPPARKVDGFTVSTTVVTPDRLRVLAGDDITTSGGARTVHQQQARSK